jgi:hypothetical protein
MDVEGRKPHHLRDDTNAYAMSNLKSPPEDLPGTAQVPLTEASLSNGLDDSSHNKRKRAPTSLGSSDLKSLEGLNGRIDESFADTSTIHLENGLSSVVDSVASQSTQENGIRVGNGSNQIGRSHYPALQQRIASPVIDRPTKRPSFGFGDFGFESFAVMDPNAMVFVDNASANSYPMLHSNNSAEGSRIDEKSEMRSPRTNLTPIDQQSPLLAATNGVAAGGSNSITAQFSNMFHKADSPDIQNKHGAFELSQTRGMCAILERNRHISNTEVQFTNHTVPLRHIDNEHLEMKPAAVERNKISSRHMGDPHSVPATHLDANARSVFAKLEAELESSEIFPPARQEERSMFDYRPSSSAAKSRHVFASLEAELMQKNNVLFSNESLGGNTPRNASNGQPQNVFADLEVELTQQDRFAQDYESFNVKSAAAFRRNSASMDAESIESLEEVNDHLDAKPAAVPYFSSRENSTQNENTKLEAASNEAASNETDSNEKLRAFEYSRSVFATLEDELMRNENELEEYQHALAPMQFLTSSFRPAARGSISSTSTLTQNGTSLLRLNELDHVEEEPVNEIQNDAAIDDLEILNQQIVMNHNAPLNPPLPLPVEQPSNALGLGGARSREIIASIEQDILRRQQEESRAEANINMGMIRHQMVIGPYSAHFYSSSSSALRMGQSLMQQHQQHLQSHAIRTNIVNQASLMTIDPIDDASVNSIASCISYDGKTSNVFSIPCQTHEQDMACQMLNRAVNDLINAPVMPILKE